MNLVAITPSKFKFFELSLFLEGTSDMRSQEDLRRVFISLIGDTTDTGTSIHNLRAKALQVLRIATRALHEASICRTVGD